MHSLPKLKPGAHIHLMGICGTAMASMAGILKNMGYKITGSDTNVYPPMSTQLEKLGIPIMNGYKAENLHPHPDLVIVGNVISKKMQEAEELLRLDLPYTSLPEAMGEWVIGPRKSVVIAGTHGKTTTTSMMAWVTTELGLEPGFLVGGIPKNFGKSFAVPHKDIFVIEGDEYDTAFFAKVPKFTYYKPYYTILGTVEFDHADIYPTMDHVVKAFEILAEKTHPDGIFIYHEACAVTREIAAKAHSRKKASFGITKGDYSVQNLKFTPEKTIFDVIYKNESIVQIEMDLFGEYNVMNTLACVALAHQVGWDLIKVKAAIAKFQGVKRRQEILGRPKGITVIEDFAHHPTAVDMTIDAVKQRFAKSKVFAVFEPRSATSRRKVFQNDYVKAFAKADSTWIAKPFAQTSIAEEDRFSSDDLVTDLKAKHKEAVCFATVEEAVKGLKSQAQKGDAILIMSNGGFDGIYQKLLTALEN